MLVVASWADVLHVREFGVAGAAINTMWQIGNFLSPYAWGLAKDATGSFRMGLIVAAGVAAAHVLTLLYTRSLVRADGRARALALNRDRALPLAVASESRTAPSRS